MPCYPGKEGIRNLLINALTLDLSIDTKLFDFKNPNYRS